METNNSHTIINQQHIVIISQKNKPKTITTKIKNVMKKLKSIFAITTIAMSTVFFACQKNEVTIPNSGEQDQEQKNTPSDSSEPGSNEHELGCIPLPENEYLQLPQIADKSETFTQPPSLNLVCPPIRSQGGEGSCVAWGAAYEAFGIAYRYKHGGAFNNSINIFSPEYVYNQIKAGSSCSSGSYVNNALDLLKSQGACTWSKMPYSSTNGCSLRPNLSQRANAASHKIVSWSTVSRNSGAIKKQLSVYKRPVIIVTPVDENFDNLGNNQVYTHYSGHYRGYHCYTVVGFDDTKKAFKIMNSWGTNWASSGFGWISYSAITTTFCKEAYILQL